jgi:cytochrome b subunit of formate dehydrogenase
MATPATTTMAGTADAGATQRYYRRFDAKTRIQHGFLMLSFLGCTLSGLPLLFAENPWARSLAHLLGGFQSAQIIHRVCAVILITVFLTHVVRVVVRALSSDRPLDLFWGPNSMVPNLKDGVDIVAHFRWFFGQGPRPQFDRYTYWEKFDYWAVFWGMFIIGGSGVMLWFPFFFSQFLPGWIFNIATLIHGEEALLAVGFIFTIHFFNGHLRPDKFPMDPVIFTGRITEHEMLEERPAEYERLARQGRLAQVETTPPRKATVIVGYLIGTTAVTLGIVMVALIVYSFIR